MTSTVPAPTPVIVVGVDGSRQSKQALRWAARFAATSGAHINAVAAWQFPNTYGSATVPIAWDHGADMSKILTSTVDEVFGAQRPPGIELTVREGNAAKILLEESRGALMVVVGSRGHGGFAGLLLGSVSTGVAAHASCPVLVLHGDHNPTEAAL